MFELARIDREVAVLGGLGQGDRCGAGAQMDDLGADQDQRVVVLGERVECVEQRCPRGDEQLIHRQARIVDDLAATTASSSAGVSAWPDTRNPEALQRAITFSSSGADRATAPAQGCGPKEPSAAPHEAGDGGHQLAGALGLLARLGADHARAGVLVEEFQGDLVQGGLDG